MRIPKTTPLSTARETVTAFGGYDHRPVIAAGSWYDQENVTADLYPTASVRKKHGTKALEGGEGPVTGIFEANGRIGYTRFVASGTPAANHGTVTFYDADGTRRDVDLGLNSSLKRFVRMGAYVIILPDLKYINSADESDRGDLSSRQFIMEHRAEQQTRYDAIITPCLEDGTELEVETGMEPEEPEDGDLWFSNTSKILYKYYAEYGGWREYPDDTYIKITYDRSTSAMPFEDGLYINFKAEYYDSGYAGDYSLLGGTYKLVKSSHTDGQQYVVLKHPFGKGTFVNYKFTFTWSVPEMDFIVESNNRLWGCKWGGSNHVNEIYASALGSFKEWYRFDKTDADSYVASVGSDGPFTGAVSFQGRPVFFKERCMHVVYGSYPSAYQIVSTECHGIETGCDRSAALVDNVLYYKSPEGFAAYDGSLPALFGAELGDVKYKKVSAGGYDRKYFAAAVDEAGKAHVLIYDTRLGLWQHAESRDYSTASLAVTTLFAEAEDDMCYVDAGDSFAAVKTWFGSGTKDAGKVVWYAETGDLGLGDLFAKYVLLISIRMRLGIGSVIRIKIRYDDGPWEHVASKAGYSLSKFTLPIRVKRCDHFRIRLEGVGDAQLYAIERTIQGGSRK